MKPIKSQGTAENFLSRLGLDDHDHVDRLLEADKPPVDGSVLALLTSITDALKNDAERERYPAVFSEANRSGPRGPMLTSWLSHTGETSAVVPEHRTVQDAPLSDAS